MPGPVYHAGAVATCPHGGQVTPIPASPRVMVSGMPVAVLTDTTLVAGCPFVAPPPAQPCVLVRWLVGAARVTVMGQPVLVQTAVGLCQTPAQVPNGPPIIASTQPRVVAT